MHCSKQNVIDRVIHEDGRMNYGYSTVSFTQLCASRRLVDITLKRLAGDG